MLSMFIPRELLTPAQVKRENDYHNSMVDRILEGALPFAEIKPPPQTSRKPIGIIAESYDPENPLDEVFPEVKTAKLFKGEVFDPTGDLSYSRTLLPRGVGLEVTPGADLDLWHSGAEVYFTKDIGIPVLRYASTRHPSGWDVWMSLTPNEIWSQRSGIQQATGHVVMGGLGMGWLLRQIAKKKSVTNITVVEKDQRILDWFGMKVCAATPKVREVICGDIYDVAGKFDFKTTKFLLDIWPSSSGAEFDKQLRELRAQGARVWAWGQPNDPKKRQPWAW